MQNHYAENWGTSVIPCPYCDGFEVADQHWGLVWSGPQSMNQVRLFHDWTDNLTVFADLHDIAPDIRADLAGRKVPVIDGRITGIVRHGSHGATIRSIMTAMSRSTFCSLWRPLPTNLLPSPFLTSSAIKALHYFLPTFFVLAHTQLGGPPCQLSPLVLSPAP